jgi:hypothetical protein
MAIRCGHCRGRHETVADVRTCGQDASADIRVDSRWPRQATVTEGLYRAGGRIFRVDRTTRGGQTGALVAHVATVSTTDRGTRVSWTIARDSLALLSPAGRMPLAEVIEFGRLTQVCLKCGRRLDTPEAVAAGIGWRCKRNLGQ